MTTHIYLVRHAQSDNSITDEASRPLTPQGMEDRHLACRYLSDKGITAIYASPYIRAAQTIHPLAEAMGLDITTEAAFRERDLGDTSGITDFRKTQWQDKDFAAPGGESLHQVQRRFSQALGRALELHRGGRVAIASHGMAICAVQNHFSPSFGYDDYLQVSDKMPRVVHLVFDGDRLESMEEIALR